MSRKSSYHKSLDYSHIQKRRRYSSSVQSTNNSPEKVQGSFKKNLIKNQSQLESNIVKYKSQASYSKSFVTPTRDCFSSRKSSQSSADRLLMLQNMEKGYSMFKTIHSSLATQRQKHLKLQPIFQTIQVKQSNKSKAQQLHELKHKKLKRRNQKLDIQVQQNGKLAPLRLVLSNKVRNKIINDLVNNNQKTQENIQNILQRQNQHQWLQQFDELKKSLQVRDIEVHQKHKKNLISRSNFNNAYYLYKALDKNQKKQMINKVKRQKQQAELQQLEVINETKYHQLIQEQKPNNYSSCESEKQQDNLKQV